MSSRMVGISAFRAARYRSSATRSLPSCSPRPSSAYASAPSVVASLSGLIACNSGSAPSSTRSSSIAADVRSWVMTDPLWRVVRAGAVGGTNDTYRSPKSVFGSSRAATSDGISRAAPGSSASRSAAPEPSAAIWRTSPTTPPPPRARPQRPAPAPAAAPSRSPRDPYRGRRAPDREREEEVHDVDRDDRQPDRPAERHTDASRPAGRGVPVVAVHQHHDQAEHQYLDERPQHVDRGQEEVEVVVVRAGRLSEVAGGNGPGGQIAGEQAHHVQRDDGDETGDHPGRHQERQRRDRHHLQRVDLLRDTHRAELGGEATADRGRQRERGDQRGDLAGVEVRRDEPGKGAAADLVERLVALQTNLGTGEERQETNHADSTADDGEGPGAEAHLGEQPDNLPLVAADRPRRPRQRSPVEEQLGTQVVEDPQRRHLTYPSAGRPGSRWP